ncbi:MAG: type II secretion system F family protein [Maribacter sp.]|nr:type II secretion system F family protein [Maribacter sp.]
MANNKIFNNKMVSLVKVAEETNQTEYIFERLNQQYEIEVQQKSKLLSTLMEPLIIIIIGIFVGVILVSIYLPMFKLGNVVGYDSILKFWNFNRINGNLLDNDAKK